MKQFLNSKAEEYKESTRKAVQPEIHRIQLQLEQELSSVELKKKADERKLREKLNEILTSKLEQEEIIQKENQSKEIAALKFDIKEEIRTLESQNIEQLNELKNQLEKDLEINKNNLKKKVEKDRLNTETELRSAQESSQKRILELKNNHMIKIEQLNSEHEELVIFLNFIAIIITFVIFNNNFCKIEKPFNKSI